MFERLNASSKVFLHVLVVVPQCSVARMSLTTLSLVTKCGAGETMIELLVIRMVTCFDIAFRGPGVRRGEFDVHPELGHEV
jgi:hypothetical protein